MVIRVTSDRILEPEKTDIRSKCHLPHRVGVEIELVLNYIHEMFLHLECASKYRLHVTRVLRPIPSFQDKGGEGVGV